MKTIRKSLLKRTVALLLTICSLLSAMVPAVSAEGSAVTFEQLTGAVSSEFGFGHSGFGAIGQVNGHDMLFLPHHKSLYVYDLDTWEKVDEEYLGMTNGYGCLVDSNGIVWAYGSKSKLFRYDPVTGKGKWTRAMGIEGSGHIDEAIEVNGKLYLGTYNQAELVEYDPATNTFVNLGKMSTNPDARRVGTLSYKNGFIYLTVNSNTSMKDPHVVVKYDLANKKIVEILDINEKDAEYFNDTWNRSSAIVGNALFITSGNQTKMLAIDISGSEMRIMDPTEMGLPAKSQGIHNGISEVIVEKDEAGNVINEKVYFMLRQKRENVEGYGWSGWSYIYEYNSKTGLATPVETFPHSTKQDWIINYIHTRRGCLVTVDRPEIEGWEGPSIFTIEPAGKVVLYNIASGKSWQDTTLTAGDGTGKSVLCITPGPEGSNTLYIGNYLTGFVTAYDITTGKMTRYDSYSSQVPQIFWYEGKCYATGYGAGSLCEVGIDQEVKMLFQLNSGKNKKYFHQERLHNVTTGDDKLFVSTAPCKGYLGGYLAWYDLETKTAYVAVEKDKVLYQEEADRAAGIWYDEKTKAPYVLSDADDTTKEFAGLIANQIPKSIVYQDGYIYGGTGIGGGSGAEPKEGESAVLFAYDVANRKLVTLDLRTVLKGFTGEIDNVRSVAADPDVQGKFWAQVAGTLYTFTYDKAIETFNIKEELSFSKGNDQDDYYYHINTWTGAPIYFKDGYIFANLREEGAGVQQLRMICKNDPSENYLLIETSERIMAFGEDNNFYITTIADSDLARFNTADRIAEIINNKAAAGNQAAADAATAKINAIGTVSLKSEAAVKAARAAYDALTADQKALVSNLDALLVAESKLEVLKDAEAKDEKLNDAKTVAGNALEAMTVTNDTTKDEVQKAVSDALAKAQISDVNGVVSTFEITAATTENAGEAKITVEFACGDALDEAVYTKTIEKLEPVAAPSDDPNLILPITLVAVCLAGIAFVSVRIFMHKGKFKN